MGVIVGSIAVAQTLQGCFIMSAYVEFDDVYGNPFIVGSLVVTEANFDVVVDGLVEGLEEPRHLGILAAVFLDTKAALSIPERVSGIEL